LALSFKVRLFVCNFFATCEEVCPWAARVLLGCGLLAALGKKDCEECAGERPVDVYPFNLLLLNELCGNRWVMVKTEVAT
jgi:hypothetical protein